MSNRKCCVPGCVNSLDNGANLHKFPNPSKDKKLFNTWVYSVGGDILQLENDHIFKYRRICHIHFEEKYYCRNNRICNEAIPTKNMPGLSSLKFRSERNALRPLQLSQASTSKEPVASQLGVEQMLLDSDIAVEGAQGKENIEPVASQLGVEQMLLDSDIAVEDEQGKENIEPVVSQLGVEQMLLDSDIAVEGAQGKENIEPVASQLGVEQMLLDSDIAVEGAQGKENIVSKRRETPQILVHKRKRALATPAEKALHKKLVQVYVKLSKCRNRNKKQLIKIKNLSKLSTNPQYYKTLDNLSATAKTFIMMQFRESKKRDKGRRFTLQEKIVALSLMKQSPKGYRFLRKIFTLPSTQTLVKLINNADIKPGLNDVIIRQIKKSTNKMSIKERLCIVLFDEMSLKANLTYNERKDRVSGFVTDGQKVTADFADHAQVFMVRGLIRNYKQPIAYTFSQAATKGPELAKQLRAIIVSLQTAGLIVVATVCDQGTNNINCIKLLLQETRMALLRTGQEHTGNIFQVNGQEIIPLYDPPHLIKGIRNNLLTKDLKYFDTQQKCAKWEHIKKLHDENPGYKGLRMIPKLTDNHVLPQKLNKMKVKFATQIFSQTVATNMGYLADKGILPPECKDTADVLIFFDKLFDSVNGSYEKKRKYGKPLLGPATPQSLHHEFWATAKKQLKNMKFVNRITGQVENVPTLINWLWTLEGIERLLKKMQDKYDVTSVWLRHLNQDPIENFFGAIRSHGCRNTNPTTDKFESTFTALLINSLSSVHAPGANCEKDSCKILQNFIISSDCKALPPCEIDTIPDIQITSLECKNDLREIGVLQYVSGYFLKKIKQNVFKGCESCKKDLMANEQPEYIKYREYAGKQWLYSPSNTLLRCISGIQDINNDILKRNLETNNVKELIKTLIFCMIDFDFIKCTEHKDKIINYMINITSRFFIYNYCKEINKILCNRRECDDDDDFYKMKAKKYFHKCIKRKNK